MNGTHSAQSSLIEKRRKNVMKMIRDNYWKMAEEEKEEPLALTEPTPPPNGAEHEVVRS